jgi:Tfp pilus assembly PilM family ATPase/Tfp pilus assembly protein PilN
MKDKPPTKLLESVRSAANAELQKVGSSCRHLKRTFRANLSKLSPRRREATVVLEVGDRLIKIAHLERAGEDLRVSDLVIKALPHDTSEIPKVIESALNELGRPKGDVVAIFPRSKAIVRYVSLPSTDHAEIGKMIDLQANKLSPFDRAEAVIDFKVVDVRDDGFSDVMVVIVDKGAISQYVDWLKTAGLEPGLVRLDAECIQDFYALRRPDLEPAGGENISLVDIDLTSTNIEIISHGRLAFMRSLPFGTATLFPEKEADRDTVDQFLDQIVDTFASYQKAKRGEMISGIILTGATLNLDHLTGELRKKLPIPVDSLNVPENSLPDEISTDTPPDEISLSTLIGAAAKAPVKCMDLSPADLRKRRAKRDARKQRLQIGILAVSVILVLTAVLYQRIVQKEAYLAALDSRIETVQPVAEGIEAIHRQSVIVRQLLSAQGSLLDSLAELYRLFPAQISVTLLNFEESGVVTIKGLAEDMSQVFELVPKLEASPVFEGVTVKYVNQRNIGQRSLIDFQVAMEVSSSGSGSQQTIE